jgi:uncharacterized protein YacL
MDGSRLATAALVVEFWVIYLFKHLDMGNSKTVKKWYDKFGALAVVSDVTSVMIGIMIANFFVPGAKGVTLALYSVVVQVIHDVLYYLLLVLQIPKGTNSVIDLMKEYGKEKSWGPIAVDAGIMVSTVGVYTFLEDRSSQTILFVALLSLYAITYVVY